MAQPGPRRCGRCNMGGEMTKRHNRDFFFMAATGQVRGLVSREATESEKDRAFHFSEIVARGDEANSDALLRALAQAMTQPGKSVDSDIPAGFTYLGQFVDHDLTLDKTEVALGSSVPNVTDLKQGRSPALDLDSVYAKGPVESGSFYAPDGIKLKVGVTKASPPDGVANRDMDRFDLPRLGDTATDRTEVRQANIPDIRNDENLAVAQTHLAFIRFHNRVCDLLAEIGTPSALIFELAREKVVKHYQWLLKTDYLPRVVDPAIVDDVFANGRKVFEVRPSAPATMPIEFSVAAFRLGHSMIRERYNWNAVFGPGGLIGDFGTLENLFRFSGTSGNLSPASDLNNPIDGTFERLPTNWVADWTQLYDFVADGVPELAPETPLNHARRIDIHLVDPLAQLPLGSFGPRHPGITIADPLELNLAFRNLVRGRMVGLASGQAVAAHVAGLVPGITVLTPEQILGAEFADAPADIRDELTSKTPLWFYILREAELNGGRLGHVGGRIVAETFHRAMEASVHSIVRDSSFSPDLASPGRFRFTDLLQIAFDASAGELRPLSPGAPRPSLSPRLLAKSLRAAE